MEKRNGWRGQNECQISGGKKRSGRPVGAAETSKEFAEWRRLQWKNLSILCLLKKKDWPQCHKESSWQVRQNRSWQRKRHRAVCPKHEIVMGEEVKVSESRTLARERGIGATAERKGWTERRWSEERQVARRRGRTSKESLPRGSRRKHERVSKRTSSPGKLAESWFHSKSGQI